MGPIATPATGRRSSWSGTRDESRTVYGARRPPHPKSRSRVGWVEPQRGEAHRDLGGPQDLRSFDPPYFLPHEDPDRMD
jgi:hypothetical protein